jgi:CheY-like chemotaxis protein
MNPVLAPLNIARPFDVTVRPPAPARRGLTHLGLAVALATGQRRGVPTATILVLEENSAVQELIDQALRESGYRVLSTHNALEAVEVVRRVRIDVLVVGDLAGEQGERLADELRSVQPELQIVWIRAPDDETEGVDRSTSLPWPFSLDDLRMTVAMSVEHVGGE